MFHQQGHDDAGMPISCPKAHAQERKGVSTHYAKCREYRNLAFLGKRLGGPCLRASSLDRQDACLLTHTYSPASSHTGKATQTDCPVHLTVGIMASGGMAELRAAEQKAAQIVQEARAGKETWCGGEGGGRALSFACRFPSVCVVVEVSHVVNTHNHGLFVSRVCACRRSGFVGALCQKAASCARGMGS